MKENYKQIRVFWLNLVLLLSLCYCQKPGSGSNPGGSQNNRETSSGYNITQEPFGTTKEGTPVSLFTLQNPQGMVVKIINYGGIITSLLTPDKNGQAGDVVLGFDSFADYEMRNPMFGALVGRFGNRIANATFTLDGQEYSLEKNAGANHIHGGRKGFDKVVWQTRTLPQQNALELTYVSPDGEAGYPGTLTTVVTYTLTPQNELRIDYRAQTTKPTPVNLTNHSYFNLSAGVVPTILNHQIYLNADRYTEVDKTLIPTGEIKPVAGTALEFKQPQLIGSRIKELTGGGYDHNYIINRRGDGLVLAARVTEPTSGRVMEVLTTQPAVQFYTANFLSNKLTGKKGQAFQPYAGFCLETQHYPNSPNQPEFPSTILRPNENYNHTTIYKFSVQK